MVFSTARPMHHHAQLRDQAYDEDDEDDADDGDDDDDEEDEEYDENIEMEDVLAAAPAHVAASAASAAATAAAAAAADDEDESLVRLQSTETLWTWGVPYLKEECRALGLAIYGSKKELV
jgi:hypothetical protein